MDIILENINGWQVVEIFHKKRLSKKNTPVQTTYIKAMCPKCKDIRTKTRWHLRNTNQCNKCYLRLDLNHDGIFRQENLGRIKKSAIVRNILFDLDIEYLQELYNKQNGKCCFTGRKIIFVRNAKKNHLNQTASLDRIDSSKGYIKDNVQWVHKDTQRMKMSETDKDFINLCHEISDYQRRNTYEG